LEKNALANVALAHQYEQKLDKCIGVVVFESEKASRSILDVFRIRKPMEYNEEMEAVLKEIPLRKVSSKPFKGYNLK